MTTSYAPTATTGAPSTTGKPAPKVHRWHLIDPQGRRRLSCQATSHDQARGRLWWRWYRRAERFRRLGDRRLFFHELTIKEGQPRRS